MPLIADASRGENATPYGQMILAPVLSCPIATCTPAKWRKYFEIKCKLGWCEYIGNQPYALVTLCMHVQSIVLIIKQWFVIINYWLINVKHRDKKLEGFASSG